MYDLAVVVPVRKGSSRIQNKSMLPFGGKSSLIEWKLEQLLKVISKDRIYLSSEDDEFLNLALSKGVRVHKRDPILSKDHVLPFTDIITGIVEHIPHQHIAWCTVVCPLMSPQEYYNSFISYNDRVINGDKDSLLGVNLLKEYFWDDNGPMNYRADRNHTVSQDLPNMYKVTNSIYMYNKDAIMRDGYFIGQKPHLEHLAKLSGIDIDYIEDYEMAQALYSIYTRNGLDAVGADIELW